MTIPEDIIKHHIIPLCDPFTLAYFALTCKKYYRFIESSDLDDMDGPVLAHRALNVLTGDELFEDMIDTADKHADKLADDLLGVLSDDLVDERRYEIRRYQEMMKLMRVTLLKKLINTPTYLGSLLTWVFAIERYGKKWTADLMKSRFYHPRRNHKNTVLAPPKRGVKRGSEELDLDADRILPCFCPLCMDQWKKIVGTSIEEYEEMLTIEDTYEHAV